MNEKKRQELTAKQAYKLAVKQANKALKRRYLTINEAVSELGLDNFTFGRLADERQAK